MSMGNSTKTTIEFLEEENIIEIIEDANTVGMKTLITIR